MLKPPIGRQTAQCDFYSLYLWASDAEPVWIWWGGDRHEEPSCRRPEDSPPDTAHEVTWTVFSQSLLSFHAPSLWFHHPEALQGAAACWSVGQSQSCRTPEDPLLPSLLPRFHFSVGCWEGVDRRGNDMGKWGSLGSQDTLKRGTESSERKEGMGWETLHTLGGSVESKGML